ncbi:putative KAP-like P-loop ATPase [Parabacteroides sp. PF5-5]|uniref:KAP family P-loop NTPase fold protein n=1 Tax=unclassified Parabacteroides TaxID=2649774 RepID=UPI0024745784|nr:MULTISPECIES: P-loop NTPase fold protein [unclassified Parabacteroides]MDH6307010.1 putative KAP-like P-loop ATPase [Parabacteroides sp. PH5-39]MDH6317858.1 putative KAP-like P-loop ATPase [Parabacteroides sp. PF5-13]MDH6321620.1 putative KAP-like P-loop ATPase [Parabacteroides sp. PH5-13]MDH6325397.1 putative KAP-like P-loop ATPase [Parabacteroides sp. PH5-8]MDH6329113.1 putative KAP-like P-loop ATPase [Parabacteroides sp. PH5-41]
MINNDFHADKPASIESEDKFQRYNFARRIAETIAQKQNCDGIIIGIYGAWGEGKTSVLNFIDSELSKVNDVICLKFNPWRYSDENSLLISFFNVLTIALDKNLSTGKEKVGEIIKKYSRLLKFDIPIIGGNIGEAADSIGSVMAEIDVEDLKKRVEQIIIDSNKKLVIFIDDIDRLDKYEIHSIFRLVKLTADFYNTTYILSFDEEVVSKSIGERYGTGDLESGKNFLEKIIQVPLTIPKAQPEALRDYCFEMINGIYKVYNIELPEGEGRRFVSLFTTSLLNKFDTPRMVVRYTNSLSFSIPLLAGEANMVDLMIIEAIKIVYPYIYKFIRENPVYFIPSHLLNRDDEKKKELVKKEIDNLCTNFSNKEKESIIELLTELFPLLETAYKNISYPDWKITGWYKNKRIASQKYFNRYFTYSVIKGEISDISFEQLVSNLSTMSEREIIDDIKLLIQNSSADNFIYKLRNVEADLHWDIAKKLVKILVVNTELFPLNPQNYLFESQSPKGQLAIFIYQVIKKHNNPDEQLSFSKEIINESIPLEFTFDIVRWLNPKEEEPNNIFTKEIFQEIWEILLKRILKEADEKDIFEAFPEESYMICKFWEGFGRDEFNKYMHKLIDENPQKSIFLLRTYLPRFRAMGDDEYRDGDFNEKTYKYLVSILDKDYIVDAIFKVYPKAELEKQEVIWKDRDEVGLTDFEMARQYYHWYLLDLEEL